MKLKTLLIFLFFIVNSITVHSQKIIRLAKKGMVIQSDYFSEIPFRYENNHIFIDVRIKGETYNFLFDTGFDFSAIDLNYIKNITYKKVLKKKVSGSSFKKQKIQFIEISTLSISEIDFNDFGASIIDLSFINKDYPCSEKPISGIIGANILRKANWQIDYKNRIIRFSDNFSKFNISEKAFRLDILSKSWGRPLVNVNINGINKEFTFDTGSSGKITTGTEFKKELSSCKKKVNFITIAKKNEFTYENYKAVIEQISIGDLYLKNQVVSLEKGVSSLIGNRFFENYTVTIDWKNEKILLEPIFETVEDNLVDFPILFRPNYSTNKIEISGFYNVSFTENKFEIGTKILSINKKDVSNFSTQELCDFWNNEWKEIKAQDKIVIETNNQKIELVKINLFMK